MGSDSYGWIWNGFGSWNWNWNWTLTLTGTEPWQELEWWVGSMGSDSSWIRELELMFLSRIDGIGLVVDPGTWQELDPGLELDRNLTLDWNWTGTWPLTGTGLVTVKAERSRTILRAAGVDHQLTQASHGWARFLGVSSTGGHLGTGLDSARKYSLGAELDLWQLGWNRNLDCLAGTGTLTGTGLEQ